MIYIYIYIYIYMYIYIYISHRGPRRARARQCEKQALLQRRALGQPAGFQSTKSGAGEQFLLKDCEATLCV